MPQIFSSSSNSYARVSIILTVVTIGVLGVCAWELIADSEWATRQGEAREQPIPFSHAHHVGSMGIDCRYCHASVENSDFSIVPPTKTCMNCHSQIWINSPTLEPVRTSYATNTSIRWTKVYDLPDYVYFNHSIHVKKASAAKPATAAWIIRRSPGCSHRSKCAGASTATATRRNM